MEIFFAKLFGIYFIIVGTIILIRRRSVIPTVKDLLGNKALLLTLASIELAAGIALVLEFPTVSPGVPGIISLVGYMMVIESIFYFAAPSRFVQKFLRS